MIKPYDNPASDYVHCVRIKICGSTGKWWIKYVQSGKINYPQKGFQKYLSNYLESAEIHTYIKVE